jgi:hypothetical protein
MATDLLIVEPLGPDIEVLHIHTPLVPAQVDDREGHRAGFVGRGLGEAERRERRGWSV